MSIIAFWATALFAAQLYLSPAQWFPQLEPLHIALILSFTGLAALCVQRVITNQPLWMGWRTAFLAIYAGEAVLSSMWSIDRAATIPGAVEVSKHFLFFVAIVNTASTPRRLRIAFTLYAIAAMVPGFGTFNNWIHDELLVEGFRGRWLGVMADPNHDAMSLVGAIPLLLFLAVGKGHGWGRRALGIIGATACIMGVIATHSRGGSIGLVVGVVAFALLSRRRAIAGTLVMVATAGVLLFAPRSFWERNETITSYAEDYSVQGRMQAWQVAFRIVKDHPFIGVGEAAFLEAWNQYAPIDAGHRHYVAHNIFLEILGQLGLIGLFGYVCFISCALWSAWRARNAEMGGEARAVLAALAGYLVCQQFSGYSLSWFLFTLCGFAACCDIWAPRKQEAVAP